MPKKEYDNSNRGALWINNDRRDGREDPHLRGNVLIRIPADQVLDNGDGTVTIHRFISGWESHSEKTGDYISVAIGQKCKKTHGE
jgi:hypothetical protein